MNKKTSIKSQALSLDKVKVIIVYMNVFQNPFGFSVEKKCEHNSWIKDGDIEIKLFERKRREIDDN